MLPSARRGRSRSSSRRRAVTGERMTAQTSRQVVDVFVEIPRVSRAKYELDHKSGHIRLDRVLHSSVHYPADYGFVMDTLGGAGDPLDAFIIVEEPTFPGCLLPAHPDGPPRMSLK